MSITQAAPAAPDLLHGNPLLDYYRQHSAHQPIRAFQSRQHAVLQWAWPVLDQPAIQAIRGHAGQRAIVDVGAGTGYVAALLAADARTTVHAYDVPEPSAHHVSRQRYHQVTAADASQAAALHPDAMLLLSWPPYDSPMAYQALRSYHGDTLAYIGEEEGGCTAGDDFHQLMRHAWQLQEAVAIPTWPGIHDQVYLYRRNAG